MYKVEVKGDPVETHCWMITFSVEQKTLDVPLNGVCLLIICFLIKKIPSNKNWVTLLPSVHISLVFHFAGSLEFSDVLA